MMGRKNFGNFPKAVIVKYINPHAKFWKEAIAFWQSN